MTALPPVLSIRQPWAHSIVAGGKDVENRTWSAGHRGPFLVHAGKGMTRAEAEDWRRFVDAYGLSGAWSDCRPADLPRGGIVGIATLTGCVTDSRSPWFAGRYGFVLRDARALPFVPCKGALGFFAVPADAANAVRGALRKAP